MENKKNILIENGVKNIKSINSSLYTNLENRLKENPTYSKEEIKEVSNFYPYLFKKDFTLNNKLSTQMSALCIFSQNELKTYPQITSHRKVIGKGIVFLKKMMWPLVKFYLNSPLKGISQFNSQVVKSISSILEEQERLKKEIEELKNR